MTTMSIAPFTSLVFLLTVASITDLRYQRIPNWLTFPAMFLALSYHTIGAGVSGLLWSAGGLAVGMAVLVLYYLLGMLGAGDVKLMGAVGALLGPADAFYAFVFSVFVGGIYAIFTLIIEAVFGNVQNTFYYRYWVMAKTFLYTRQFAYIRPTETEKKVRLCYGVAISLGTLGFVLWKHGRYYNWLGLLPG